jgi:hypothetical protein
VADSATWNWVFYKSIFATGDVIKVTYSDPIVVRDDVFTFTTPEAPDTSYFIPVTYYLFQNYPNPFNPGTKIRFYIPEQSLVRLEIYDILGQRVAQLINEELTSDTYEIEFNGSAFASGVYIYVLNIPDKFFEAKKMILLK